MQALGSEPVRSAYRSLSIGSMAAHWYFRSTTCKKDGSLGASMVEVESKIDHPEVLDPFCLSRQLAMRVEKASWVVHKDREAGGDKLPIYSIDVHPDGTRFATGGGGTSTAHRRCLPRFLLAHRLADPRPLPRTPPLLVPCALPPCR